MPVPAITVTALPSPSSQPTPPVIVTPPSVPPANPPGPSAEGIHKIQHIIIIMQENRAFDEYFGTYPGADGIPMMDGVPSVCIPDPDTGQCVRPYHDPRDVNYGGPHSQYESEADINGGKMDGYIGQAEIAINNTCTRTAHPGVCMADLAEKNYSIPPNQIC